jgi:dTDP-4-amino-4,6-dideoxygalactose transaminase
LDAGIANRRERVRSYRRRLAGIPGIEVPFDDAQVELSSHFCFPVLAEDREARDRLRAGLAERGIQTTWYPALQSFSDYRQFTPADGLPAASEAAVRHCALPLSSSMQEGEVEIVVEALADAVGASAPGRAVDPTAA